MAIHTKKIFDTEWLNESGFRNNYGRKKPYFSRNEKHLEKYLLDAPIDELKKLEKDIKSTAIKLRKMNDELQPVVNRGFKAAYKYRVASQNIEGEVQETFPDPVKIFFISTGDIWEARRKRDELSAVLHKQLLPLEHKVHNIYNEVVELVKLQFKELDKLLPKFKESVFWHTYDDDRWLPGITIEYNSPYIPGWTGSQEENEYIHAGLTMNFSTYRTILDMLPSILADKEKRASSLRVKKKRQERSATLAAYEDKSRNVGKSIMAKMKAKIKAPYHCPYCLKKTPKTKLHVDHINPVSNGGLSVERNLIPVCSECNLIKSDSSLRAFCKKSDLDFESVCDRLEEEGKFI